MHMLSVTKGDFIKVASSFRSLLADTINHLDSGYLNNSVERSSTWCLPCVIITACLYFLKLFFFFFFNALKLIPLMLYFAIH